MNPQGGKKLPVGRQSMNDQKLQDFARRLSAQSDNSSDQTPIPAATVVLLRDGTEGIETLMLRKNSRIAFGGMWVFPGGRIDAEDGGDCDDMEHCAREAASREAMEEAGLLVDSAAMHWFSHWTPPAVGNRRFQTWFFAAAAPSGEVRIDEGEITESQWIAPASVLEKQRCAEVELVPPTYVTLHYLAKFATAAEALSAMDAQEPRHYATRLGHSGDDLVAMWEGDAGYDSGQADIPGPRHRLTMCTGGFRFDDSGHPFATG
jgi:8-oxo-dGTP pyrophosphatase MutT (NUDIX family)